MYSRREFGKLTISGVTAAATMSVSTLWAQTAAANSTVRGVKLGIIGAGFRNAGGGAGRAGAPGAAPAANALPPVPDGVDPVDVFIQDLKSIGVYNLESGLNSTGSPRVTGGTVSGNTPATLTPEYTQTREALRQWRLTAPLDRQREIASKFKAAGINLFSGVVTISDDCTDPEIDAIFKQMDALGVKVFCTNGTRVGMGPRIKPFAEKYKISPAFHTHAQVDDPNEVASPASLDRLLAMSPLFMVNLDIGHFTAGNQDAVATVRRLHDRITHLHVKDRKRDNGPSVIWGTGDTPINQVLTMIRDNKWPIYAIIERDNRDEEGSPIELTKKYMDYMKRVLES